MVRNWSVKRFWKQSPSFRKAVKVSSFISIVVMLIGIPLSVITFPFLESFGIQYILKGKPQIQLDLQSTYLENYSIAGSTSDVDPVFLIISQQTNNPLTVIFKTEEKNSEKAFDLNITLNYSKIFECNCTQNWLTIKNTAKRPVKDVNIFFDTSQKIGEIEGLDARAEFIKGRGTGAHSSFSLFIRELEEGEEYKVYFPSEGKLNPIQKCSVEGFSKYCQIIYNLQIVSDISEIVEDGVLELLFESTGRGLHIGGIGERFFIYKFNFDTGEGGYLDY